MSKHPIFLIVDAKLGELAAAMSHMNAVDEHQRALRESHPDLYAPAVHAESLATNVQGIYTQLEAILKTLTQTIDGFSPAGESWHRDLLLQAAGSDENRPAMIDATTLQAMTELLRFWHAFRNNYASALRQDDVFRNAALLQDMTAAFVANLNRFAQVFDATPPATARDGG